MSTSHLPPVCAFTATMPGLLQIPAKDRKMGGDAGGRGDVDAQRETCCSPAESKLFWFRRSALPFPRALTEQKHFFHTDKTDFQKLGDVSCRSCCKSAPFPKRGSARRASVAATIATGGNLLLLL